MNKNCRVCGTEFIARDRNGEYCSHFCADKARKEQQKKYFNTKYYPENRERIIKKSLENKKK